MSDLGKKQFILFLVNPDFFKYLGEGYHVPFFSWTHLFLTQEF